MQPECRLTMVYAIDRSTVIVNHHLKKRQLRIAIYINVYCKVYKSNQITANEVGRETFLWHIVASRFFLEDKSVIGISLNATIFGLFIFGKALQRIQSLNPGTRALCKATRCKVQGKSLAVLYKTE